MRVKEESERASLRPNIKKTKTKKPKIMAFGSMANRRGNGGSSDRVPLLGPKSLRTVTAAMKSEDSCFLAGKR